jgi:hypothetical protein
VVSGIQAGREEAVVVMAMAVPALIFESCSVRYMRAD